MRSSENEFFRSPGPLGKSWCDVRSASSAAATATAVEQRQTQVAEELVGDVVAMRSFLKALRLGGGGAGGGEETFIV